MGPQVATSHGSPYFGKDDVSITIYGGEGRVSPIILGGHTLEGSYVFYNCDKVGVTEDDSVCVSLSPFYFPSAKGGGNRYHIDQGVDNKKTNRLSGYTRSRQSVTRGP